jgi:hypothetical protein
MNCSVISMLACGISDVFFSRVGNSLTAMRKSYGFAAPHVEYCIKKRSFCFMAVAVDLYKSRTEMTS